MAGAACWAAALVGACMHHTKAGQGCIVTRGGRATELGGVVEKQWPAGTAGSKVPVGLLAGTHLR